MRIVRKGLNIKVILRATAVLMCVAAGALA